jgi:F-type H+-transporting ATPase subunit delta
VAGRDSGSGALAARYAAALFELADEQKQVDQVAGDLTRLKAMIGGSADLQKLLRSPVISRESQGKAMAAVAAGAGFGDLAKRFVALVASNRRLFALADMIDAFLTELARRRGEIRAEVTAAQALTDKQQAALSESIRRVVGGKVAIDVKVDPALIGGMIVKVGSRMVDSSLKSKLQRLQLAMKGVG